jgi:hypothetical protein
VTIFRIEMLAAEEGDALWIEYGSATKPRRLLVDGGVLATYPALRAKIEGVSGRCRFELAVVTHVDNDHIDAMVKLLASDCDFEVGDFWFNAWDQIKEDRLGAKQGEMLTDLIEKRGFPHNNKAKGGPIGVPSDTAKSLPTYQLPGGMKVTVVGPEADDLRRLRKEWKRVIEAAGLEPGGEFTGAKLLEKAPRYTKDRLGTEPPNVERWANRAFKEDGSAPNASSIALLLEYKKRRVLLTGDSRSGSLIPGIDRLLAERQIDKLEIDALKVPHHGSKNNLSNDLASRLACTNFLLSSSGRKFHHPDDDAVARILLHSSDPVLHFNYRTKDNEDWDRKNWKTILGYKTAFPEGTVPGLVVNLDPQ